MMMKIQIVMSMYNLVEYSSNSSETTENLQFYSKNESTNFNADLLNFEPSNLVFLKNCNTEFDKIFITLTSRKGRLLTIEEKVNLTWHIN